MSKALSTGTLSLRFMQRGPGAVPAALPQAPVADDGAWAVPQALRAAWAADGAPREIAQEASYLPFMPTGGGRRSFNAQGAEVVPAQPADMPAVPDAAPDWSKGAQRPATISGSTGSTMVPARREHAAAARDQGREPRKGRPAGKSARLLVHDEGADGAVASASLSTTTAAPTTRPKAKPAAPPVFLKPAGVDAPPPAKRPRAAGGEKSTKKKPRTSG